VPVRVVVTGGLSDDTTSRLLASGEPDIALDWHSERRNAVCDVRMLRAHLPSAPSVECDDLIDVATAIYLADIAVQRGFREQWVRDIQLTIPVRRLDFWQESRVLLNRLLYRLARDRFQVTFVQRDRETEADSGPGQPAKPFEADCVCLLSGGLDSLAGAVMLLRSGRRPHFVLHNSGNVTVAKVQRQVIATLNKHWPQTACYSVVRIAPDTSRRQALAYPPPELREPSRRTRSLLFMALGAVAAAGQRATEVYMCENGVLTCALPLTESRLGSFTTASTHPQVLSQFCALCDRAGLHVQVLNPFAYQTKGQILEKILRPALGVREIQQTISCWAAGRRYRQCGGCIPCILRRFSMLAAGLPDEVYEMDLLRQPQQYRGTDAYTNLVDFLRQAATIRSKSDVELLLEFPGLLDLQTWGVSLPDVVTMLRRHSDEVYHVATTHFPALAKLLHDTNRGEQ